MSEIQELTKLKNYAYWERNQLVAALSKIFPAHLAKHSADDKDWDDDWRTIVVIKLPVDSCIKNDLRFRDKTHTQIKEINRIMTSYPLQVMQGDDLFSYFQLTWHIHDVEIPMFDHLVYEEYDWDGHDNELKYRRLRLIKPIKNEKFV